MQGLEKHDGGVRNCVRTHQQTKEEGTSPLISFPSPTIEKGTSSPLSLPHLSFPKEVEVGNAISSHSHTMEEGTSPLVSPLSHTRKEGSFSPFSSPHLSTTKEQVEYLHPWTTEGSSSSPNLFESRLSPTTGEVGSAPSSSTRLSKKESSSLRKAIACQRCRRLKKKVGWHGF